MFGFRRKIQKELPVIDAFYADKKWAVVKIGPQDWAYDSSGVEILNEHQVLCYTLQHDHHGTDYVKFQLPEMSTGEPEIVRLMHTDIWTNLHAIPPEMAEVFVNRIGDGASATTATKTTTCGTTSPSA